MSTDQNPVAGVTGTYTTNGKPNSYTSLTPFVAVTDAAAAVAFYQTVFGAQLLDHTEVEGIVIHAELDFEQGRLQVGEAIEEFNLMAQPDAQEACYSLGLYVPEVDQTVAKAVDAGASLVGEVMTTASGDRVANIRDPFGVNWGLMTRVEDLSDEESARRFREWVASQKAEWSEA